MKTISEVRRGIASAVRNTHYPPSQNDCLNKREVKKKKIRK